MQFRNSFTKIRSGSWRVLWRPRRWQSRWVRGMFVFCFIPTRHLTLCLQRLGAGSQNWRIAHHPWSQKVSLILVPDSILNIDTTALLLLGLRNLTVRSGTREKVFGVDHGSDSIFLYLFTQHDPVKCHQKCRCSGRIYAREGYISEPSRLYRTFNDLEISPYEPTSKTTWRKAFSMTWMPSIILRMHIVHVRFGWRIRRLSACSYPLSPAVKICQTVGEYPTVTSTAVTLTCPNRRVVIISQISSHRDPAHSTN
jgi:hypothetical protein